MAALGNTLSCESNTRRLNNLILKLLVIDNVLYYVYVYVLYYVYVYVLTKSILYLIKYSLTWLVFRKLLCAAVLLG